MATSTFRNKNEVRTKKQGAAKRKRIKDQKKRLVKLGMTEEMVAKMQCNDLRAWLKRPKVVQEMFAKKDEAAEA